MKRLSILLIAILLLSACSGLSVDDTASGSIHSSEASSGISEHENPISEPDGEQEESQESSVDFDTILSQQQSLVVDSAFSDPLENTTNLIEWVQSYRLGYSSSVSILLDGSGFPSALFVLESDGSPTYTITEYRQGAADKNTYQSSIVIERAYDYVFGADIPADVRPHAIVIHHTAAPKSEDIVWNPAKDNPFYGITPLEAEQRAEEVEYWISKHMSVISNIYGGGVYLKESVLAQAGENYKRPQFYYKTVGAIRLGDHLCYLVYGHADKEALERGEHGGSVITVSSDGALVFLQSMVDGSWIFADDANQASYPGTWPEVHTDFYTKAYAMGYTDQQLESLANASWASANTVLNLTRKDIGFSFGSDTTSHYALGGYLVDAGGEGMTACMYLRDNQTSRVTILPDWQNGYSSFGFLDEKRFYAAIAQVGGADYEAGIRFYNADSPSRPYARWDLTDSSVESDLEKRLLTTYNSSENNLLVAFWCEIPVAWGGWVEDDTRTYQVTVLNHAGEVVKNINTGVKLTQGNLGISPPVCDKPNDSMPQVSGMIYFEAAGTVYTLGLESGAVEPAGS